MTEEQRRRIEQLQQRRAASPRAKQGSDGTVVVSRRAPTRRAPKQHIAQRSRMMALSGSVFGATLLVSSMWTQAAVQSGSASPAPSPDPQTIPATTQPQDGVIHIRFVRVPNGDGTTSLRQVNPTTEVTTPAPVDPQPTTTVAPAPAPVTRSRGS
jgi:hypothetical protein